MKHIMGLLATALVSILLVVSLCGFSIEGFEYRDIEEGAWYTNSVEYVVKNKLMVGISSTSFGPQTKLTRAMIAQILYRMGDDPPLAEYDSKFSDVNVGAWYYNAVNWATNKGVMAGYGGGKFGPEDYLTREQLATVLYRYSGETETNINLPFKDVDKIHSWAEIPISWAVNNGIISGYGNRTVGPRNYCTRAEVATMIKNYCEKVGFEPPDVEIIEEDTIVPLSSGAVEATYHGDVGKVKLKVTHESGKETIYLLPKDKRCTFTYPYGAGKYTVGMYENTYGNRYKKILEEEIQVSELDAIKSLTASTSYYNYQRMNGVLGVVSRVWDRSKSDYDNAKALYEWICKNISYDSDRAKTVESGYYPDLSLLVDKKRGICLDIASLYSSMLRSQGIKSQIVIGKHTYGYHAWCIVMLNGKWVLIDPTYGATSNESARNSYFDAPLSIRNQYREDYRC